MGKKISPLSAKTVEKLMKVEGVYAVGGASGLYLRVVGNSATWIFRYSMAGRRRDKGMGPCSGMTLEEARGSATEIRKLLRTGTDPVDAGIAERRTAAATTAKRMTFSQCVTAYIEAHGDGWKNPKHRAQWQSTLDTYAGPFIGNLDVALVDTGLVLKCLEPIWKTKNETASRLRGRIESVLSWATTRGYRTGSNPALWKGHLDTLLVKPAQIQKVEHHAALPYSETGVFMAELREKEGYGARALEFAILTAARSGEVRGCTWNEIDLDARTWTIPAERMKAGKEHRVPLSDRAIELLEALPKLGDVIIVFPGTKGQPLSDMSLTAVLRRMDRGDLTAHGFRSTFRDWAGETTAHPREVIEHALAHQLKDKAEAAYAHGTLFAKRVRLMDDWAKYCGTIPATGNVLQLRKQRDEVSAI
jgi:integrase